MTDKTEAEAIERMVRGSTVHMAGEFNEVPFVVVPEGYTVHDLEAMSGAPRRITECPVFSTADSFANYVKAWATPDVSVIFANEKDRSLFAVLDYHEGAADPSWCSHRARYTAELSREAKAWFACNDKAMEQAAFADFLEEHASDVVQPSGATLLDLALKLQVIQKATFGSSLRLQSGEFQLAWSKENEKGTVELPEKIALGIPIFHNGVAYRVEARLRYRLLDGKVAFTYKLVEFERAVEDAFRGLMKQVGDRLPGVRMYEGAR